MHVVTTETTYASKKFVQPTTVTEIKKETKDSSVKTDPKFDVSKIRSDTLIKYSTSKEIKDEHIVGRFESKDLDLKDSTEITKQQVKPVIDDILYKGSIAAATRSPVSDKDIKKDLVEIDKRSYDAKAPHKEERRHSCISPALSLERIAESDVETDEEDLNKEVTTAVPIEKQESTDIPAELKKSDSAMKQMADNIEIIIKQASEDIDISSEEAPVPSNKESHEIQDIVGKVSVDSIIEEAVTTVQEYLESCKEEKETEIESKKETVLDENKKNAKERPALIKSLSRDSGEIMILPKKKHPRTFSVQSSPEEIEEQIYTDSESGSVTFLCIRKYSFATTFTYFIKFQLKIYLFRGFIL